MTLRSRSRAFRLYLGALTALTLVVVPLPVIPARVPAVPTVPQRASVLGYSRSEFGDGWAVQPSGCTTRQEAMAAAYAQESCAASYAQWGSTSITDPYTGEPLPPHEVELDHLYPLRAAWDMGAHAWPADKRRAFANDPANLVVTSSRANQAKSDKLPGEWLPPRRAARCDYSRRLATVAAAYELPLERSDLAAMRAACSSLPALVSNGLFAQHPVE